MKAFLCYVFALAVTMPAFAAEEKVDEAEIYRTGETMAECAAVLYFFANQFDKSMAASKTAVQDKARAWELASSFMLSMSGSDGRKLVPGFMSAQTHQLKARAEIQGADAPKAMMASFNETCLPLVPLQEEAIRQMRQAAANPSKK